MFKLAHISDIHLAPLPRPSLGELMSKRITGYVNWQKNRANALDDSILAGLVTHMKAHNPDHIAVTGDMINLALPAEFPIARQWLEKLGNPTDVSLVLGNHDTYVKKAFPMAMDHWGAFMQGDRATPESAFPYLRHRGDICIIGCNSGVATPPFFATGRFDDEQASRLEKILHEEGAAGRFRVVMIHHPPFEGATSFHKRLINAERFRRVIKSVGAELVLHGHTHIDSLEKISGPAKDVPVVGVPAAGQIPGGHKPASRYNLFSISRSDGGWSCRMEEYGYDKQKNIDRISSTDLVISG